MSAAAPAGTWTSEDLDYLVNRRELEIAAQRDNGSPGLWTPIWVVVVNDEVFVRTWQRRDTGWYGRAISAKRCAIRISGASVDVTVDLVGTTGAEATDAAYGSKYGMSAARSMITAEAAASTLRLSRGV